jgi:hypothetical protein
MPYTTTSIFSGEKILRWNSMMPSAEGQRKASTHFDRHNLQARSRLRAG